MLMKTRRLAMANGAFDGGRVVSETKQAIEALRRCIHDLNAVRVFTERLHDCPTALQGHLNDGLPSIRETLADAKTALTALEAAS